MAASTENHASGLDLEILVGSYEQVLFGYKLTESEGRAALKLSITDKSHCASVRSLAVSDNGILASGGADETVFLFNLKTRTEFGTLMKHTGTVTHLEFYDQFMISSDDHGTICVWKSGSNFECLRTLKAHKGAVNSMSVHPSGKLLLSVGSDNTLRTWNLITAKRAYTTNTKSSIDIVKWTPDGAHYILMYNGKLDICAVSNAAVVHSVKLPGKGHSLTYITGNIAAIACEGGCVAFVNLTSGQFSHDLQLKESSRVKCVSSHEIDKDQSMMALVTSEGRIELHLVSTEGDQVETTLVCATRTSLRPVCMKMALLSETSEEVSEDEDADELPEDQPITSEEEEVKGDESTPMSEVKGRKSLRDSLNKKTGRRKRSAEEEQVTEVATSHPAKKKKGKAKSTELTESTNKTSKLKAIKNTEVTEPVNTTTGQKKKGKMDRVKKQSTDKNSNNNEQVQETRQGLSKRHKRPVDSVKILKKKLEKQAKQNHAKHHDIHVEETETGDS